MPVATLSKPDSSSLESATALTAAPDRGRAAQGLTGDARLRAVPPWLRHERSLRRGPHDRAPECSEDTLLVNTTISATRPGRTEQQHPPSPTLETRTHVRRVGPVDRLALRLGLALVAWSRRPREFDSRDRQVRRLANARATERRERSQERLQHLLLPPR